MKSLGGFVWTLVLIVLGLLIAGGAVGYGLYKIQGPALQPVSQTTPGLQENIVEQKAGQSATQTQTDITTKTSAGFSYPQTFTVQNKNGIFSASPLQSAVPNPRSWELNIFGHFPLTQQYRLDYGDGTEENVSDCSSRSSLDSACLYFNSYAHTFPAKSGVYKVRFYAFGSPNQPLFTLQVFVDIGDDPSMSVYGMSQYSDTDFGFSFWYPTGWMVQRTGGTEGDQDLYVVLYNSQRYNAFEITENFFEKSKASVLVTTTMSQLPVYTTDRYHTQIGYMIPLTPDVSSAPSLFVYSDGTPILDSLPLIKTITLANDSIITDAQRAIIKAEQQVYANQ